MDWKQEVLKRRDLLLEDTAYLYNRGIIEENIKTLKQALPGFDLLYSMKANSNRDIVRIMHENGVGLDAASAAEVHAAQEAGIKSENIYYSAPGKTRGMILSTIGKSTVIADSLTELKLISSLNAERGGDRLPVGIRINPTAGIIADGDASEIMTGKPSKFGVDEDMLFEHIPQILSDPAFAHIELVGIHIYLASGILDVDKYLNYFNMLASLLDNLKQSGINLRFVNIGGGYGITYEETDKPLDLIKLNAAATDFTARAKAIFPGLRCLSESGRFLIANSAVYATMVCDAKLSRGKQYVVLNGGMNTFFRPVFQKATHKLHLLEDGVDITCETSGETLTTDICGNLCTPIDTFYSDMQLPKVLPGSLAYFENAGAYGYSMSLLEFISHKRPLEIWI